MKKMICSAAKYIYLGDRFTDPGNRGRQCNAVELLNGKCIRGRNGNMLVDINGTKTVVVARLLRKIKYLDK